MGENPWKVIGQYFLIPALTASLAFTGGLLWNGGLATKADIAYLSDRLDKFPTPQQMADNTAELRANTAAVHEHTKQLASQASLMAAFGMTEEELREKIKRADEIFAGRGLPRPAVPGSGN